MTTTKSKPKSVSIGRHFEEFIKRQVDGGRFGNDSEVMREALRLMEEREEARTIRIEALKAELQKGLNSGRGKPAEHVFDRLEAKLRGD
jgi:antitoxin ParD1/3/4